MEKANTFVKSGLKKVVLRTILTAALTGITVGLLGCGRLSAIENNQLNLQETMKSNSWQLVDNLAAIESNQRQLRGRFETGTKQIAGNLVVLEENQLASRSEINTHLQQLLDNIAAFENTQLEAQGRINRNTRQLSDNTANIVAIEKRLLKLQQTAQSIENSAQEIVAQVSAVGQVVENRTQQTNKNIRAIEQSLLKLQTKLADVQNSTGEVTTRVAAIENNQLKLQDVIESNIRHVVKNIGAIDRLNESVLPDAPPGKRTFPRKQLTNNR